LENGLQCRQPERIYRKKLPRRISLKIIRIKLSIFKMTKR
jgi:hypothetical protein